MNRADILALHIQNATARAQADRDAQLRQALDLAARQAHAEQHPVPAEFIYCGCEVLLVPLRDFSGGGNGQG